MQDTSPYQNIKPYLQYRAPDEGYSPKKTFLSTNAGGGWINIDHKDDNSTSGFPKGIYSLRKTYFKGSLIDPSLLLDNYNQEYGVILGGSTAWGHDAENCKFTPASILSHKTQIPFFTFALPGDTILQQLERILAFVHSNDSLKPPSYIVALIGFNEIFWCLTSEFLTPYGYLERQSAYFFGSSSKDYSIELKRRAMAHGVIRKNPTFIAELKHIKRFEKQISLVKEILEEHLDEAIFGISSIFNSSKKILVQQPSAVLSFNKLSEDELRLFRSWRRKSAGIGRAAFNFMGSGGYESLMSSFQCTANKYSWEYLDYSNAASFSPDNDNNLIFNDECHLSSLGFYRLFNSLSNDLKK